MVEFKISFLARRRSVHSDWTYTLKHYKIWGASLLDVAEGCVSRAGGWRFYHDEK